MCFYIDMCTFLEAHLFLQSCCQTKAIMENSFICWSNKTRTTIRYETVDVLVHSTAARVEPVQPQSWCWHEADTGSKWTLLHNNLKNVEFRKKKSISTKCFFLHLFHQQINYCVFNMTDFLYVLWYSTDFAGAVLIQTNIASIQSFLRPGLYVFAEPYCLLSANMCSSFQENSRPWSQHICKIVGIYYIQIKDILLWLWCFFSANPPSSCKLLVCIWSCRNGWNSLGSAECWWRPVTVSRLGFSFKKSIYEFYI